MTEQKLTQNQIKNLVKAQAVIDVELYKIDDVLSADSVNLVAARKSIQDVLDRNKQS